MTNYRGRTATLSLAEQDLCIRRKFPRFTFVRSYLPRQGVWRGKFQPREVSGTYSIEVRYTIGHSPKVFVIHPKIAADAPHRWQDGSLCLYWPRERAWIRSDVIAETILPWAALWLYYYELWLDTGRWLGPSSHAVPKSTDERAS